jgi:hypothetical protein
MTLKRDWGFYFYKWNKLLSFKKKKKKKKEREIGVLITDVDDLSINLFSIIFKIELMHAKKLQVR